MFVYLDESGDLGFDFTKGGTTRFFVVTLLIVDNRGDNQRLERAVERTLKNKIRKGGRIKNSTAELKGARTKHSIKVYFLNQLNKSQFRIFTLILNKARILPELRGNKKRLYNYAARLLIEKCPFGDAKEKIVLSLDKSKNRKGIREFNQYLLLQLQGLLPVDIPIEIDHVLSYESKGIQAVDSFSWGIFRKYERGDDRWYDLFKERIVFESLYLQ